MILKNVLNNFKDKHILFLILENILWYTKEQVYLNWDEKIDNKTFEKIKSMYEKYEKENIPIEYILWYCKFMNENFIVNENTLIPRPETEYLVLQALKNIWKDDIILDIWTWSGIIAIMLNKLTNNQTWAIDISEKALKVAKQNAKNILKNTDNIHFLKSNLLENFQFQKWKKYIICANLPYVKEDFNLDKLAKKEPATALFAWKDGLLFYRKLLEQIKNISYTAYFELTNEQAKTLESEYNLNFQIFPTCHKNIKILKIEKI